MVTGFLFFIKTSLLTVNTIESYSKGEFLAAQDEHASLRLSIWRDLSQFEDKTAKLTSDTILSNQSGNVADEYYQCHLLTKQISTIFTVMDLLFKHVTRMYNFMCQRKRVTKLTSFHPQHIYFSMQICRMIRLYRSSKNATYLLLTCYANPT